MSEKTTLPFMTQYAGGLYGTLFDPNFADAFQSYKPQMYEQLFTHDKSINPRSFSATSPIGLYTQAYDPWKYLQQYYNRPGGPSQAETSALDTSLFGLTAPLNLGGPAGANQAQSNYANMWGGGATGTDFSNAANLYQSSAAHIFDSLGGQITAPTPPTLGEFNMPSIPAGLGGTFTPPSAPTLAPFQMLDAPTINVPGMMQDTYQQLLASQPGLRKALRSSLNPQIALPEQSIAEMVQGFGGDPMMQAYVDAATQGMQGAYEKNLQDRILEMQSRFAGEGSYLSSPMFQGQGELTAQLTADYLNTLGQMQLGAAEAERQRQYTAASQQYGTEYERNLAQVQIQAQQAATLAREYGQMAQAAASTQGGIEQQLYANQLQALSNEYSTQASYLSSTYGSMVSAAASGFGTQQAALASIYGAQVGAAADAYGTQAGFLSNLYNTGMDASLQQQNIVANQTMQAMQLLQTGQAQNFDQAMQMAQAQQANQQSALLALQGAYYTPGQNALSLLQTYFGLPTVSKSTGIGFDVGSLLGSAASIAKGA